MANLPLIQLGEDVLDEALQTFAPEQRGLLQMLLKGFNIILHSVVAHPIFGVLMHM